MKLTMPQILMLNHAAYVNKTRSDRKQAKKAPVVDEPSSEPTFRGKPLSQLSSEEYALYVSS